VPDGSADGGPAHDGPAHGGPLHGGPAHLGRPLSRRERREAEDARARGGAPRRFPRLRRWLHRWVVRPLEAFLDALGNAF
jgi:hypothetical protein